MYVFHQLQGELGRYIGCQVSEEFRDAETVSNGAVDVHRQQHVARGVHHRIGQRKVEGCRTLILQTH